MSEQQGPQPGEFLLYETEDGRTRVECRFVADTLWLPQGGMADLFQTSKQNVAKHLKSIFAEAELDPASVVNHLLTTAADGKNYRVAYYNLDAILAVGYRVRSARGTQFRRWASERRMYLRVREIFAMAADYAPTLPQTTRFFRVIQNKLHFAVTGKTAAELIAERSDSSRPNMGLTTWKSGSVQKADVTVAKNSLHEPEIGELNRIVTMWLDAFLKFNERNVLDGAGPASKKQADAHAESEYEQFAAQRRALLEAEGAEFNVRALEEAAKALPTPGKTRA